MSLEVEVLEDPARACSAMLLSAVLGDGHVVLAGGSTPRLAYEELTRALLAMGRDFGDATLWFGDERCVPPHDDRSNYRMVKEVLLDPLADLPAPDVRRIPGELGPEQGAEAYERELRDAGSPKFDLVLLGLGPDGHTASLFPDQDTLSERSLLVVPVPEAGMEPFVPRVSLSLPALAAARQVAGDRRELSVGLRLVDRLEPFVELVHREPPVPGGLAQHLRHAFAVGVGGAQVLRVGHRWATHSNRA